MLALIPALGPILEFLLNNAGSLAGGIGTVFMAVIIWFAKKYLVPFLEVERRHQYAGYIATIADEITDDLVRKYPDEPWAKYFDEAVDRIIDICKIDADIARRAVSAALSRK